MLCIDEASLVAIKEHGQKSYPEECCGILLGKLSEDGKRSLVELRSLENRNQQSPRNRFLIDAKDMMDLDKHARERGLEMIGFYHSHPDAEARPSQFDRDNAWPWYYYVIVSINQGIPGSLTCWHLEDDRSRFQPVEVSLSTSEACLTMEEKSDV
ncbi:MAG TPA: M67 family metallopeptidase [Acidobacteriota bacterium]|jgi:proteasome lid subunit RPN8/RPN11|nr:M67 family metallopeptidase [Acidobacteriota bacterium]